MQTVRFPKIGINVDFKRGAGVLRTSIVVPTPQVNSILQKMREFKQRVQFLPGFGAIVYHHVTSIEEAIVAALEEPPEE